MKLRLMFQLFFGLSLFSSLLIFNHNTASAGYSRCQTVPKESPIPYCFKRGDSGHLIKILVEDLRKAGYYQGKTTTQFNSQVQKAVIKFQQDYRTIEGSNLPILIADGKVGENTLIRLCQAVGRGCEPNATYVCYIGSPVPVNNCLNKYKE